ncbi:MAG: hypothetical protein ACFFDS_08130 [Candidatus Thorarchaeota archaeon]
MATQNKRKILDLGFSFYGPKSKQNKNQYKLHRRNSQTAKSNYRKSLVRATYNSMFYGY